LYCIRRRFSRTEKYEPNAATAKEIEEEMTSTIKTVSVCPFERGEATATAARALDLKSEMQGDERLKSAKIRNVVGYKYV